MFKKIAFGGAILVALAISGSALLGKFMHPATTAAAVNSTITPITTVLTLPQQIANLQVEIDTSASIDQANYDSLMAKLNQIEAEVAALHK